VVVYTSNRTGIPQVYVAHVPDGMSEALRHSLDWRGFMDDPRPHYMLRRSWDKVE
jgi:hypothetical protein